MENGTFALRSKYSTFHSAFNDTTSHMRKKKKMSLLVLGKCSTVIIK